VENENLERIANFISEKQLVYEESFHHTQTEISQKIIKILCSSPKY
jgi:hypothetical protein